MKSTHHLLKHLSLLIVCGWSMASSSRSNAQDAATAILPVSSSAFFFSPANWSGDAGRAGKLFRQSWYPGSYFRVTWTTANENPTADLLLDVSTLGKFKSPPALTYCIDGAWTSDVKCEESIPIKGLKGPGSHTLTVYFSTSEQADRWGTEVASGLNVLRVTGLRLNRDCTSIPATPGKKWALIVGDSITEGSAANNGKSDSLAAWSYFVGAGLQSIGYEYGVSACGFSGWIRPGDSTRDVPPYYMISKSVDGSGGSYDDVKSRWNKIDARTSLLDEKKRLSGYGGTEQEPSIILINYATNDGLSHANSSDLQASITQSIQALQKSAPQASIFIIVPFGQYGVKELKAGVQACLTANPTAPKVHMIDLGPAVAKGLEGNNYWSGLHPNMRGHATFAAQILTQILPNLPR